MKMKLIKRCIVVLMAMIFVMPCCKAGEEIDRIEEIYLRRTTTSIEEQLQDLSGVIDKPENARRPLILVFGSNSAERFHFNFSDFNDPLVVYIQLHDGWTTTPKNEEQVKYSFGVKDGRDSYREIYKHYSKENTLNHDPSYDDIKELFIKTLSDPCVVIGDILSQDLYTRFSSKYAGRFDLITTDLGVNINNWSYDALSHYTQLLKTGGTMILDTHVTFPLLESIVTESYLDIKNIRDSEGINPNKEKLKRLKRTRKEFDFRPISAKFRHSIPVFIEKILSEKTKIYRGDYEDMKYLPRKILFSDGIFTGSPDPMEREFNLEEDTIEYRRVISEIRAQNFSAYYESKMNELQETLFNHFFSQENFRAYEAEYRHGFLPYCLEERHRSGELEYVVIRRNY